MRIIIDTDRIEVLKGVSRMAVMKEEGEYALLQLIKEKQEIDSAIDEVKEKIKESALKADKNFVGYNGDYVKIELRKFGSTYCIERPEVVSDEFVKTKTTKTVDTEKVEEYLEAHNELPEGIERLEREPQIVIKTKEE